MRRNIDRTTIRIPAASQRLLSRDKNYLVQEPEGGVLVIETASENLPAGRQTAILID